MPSLMNFIFVIALAAAAASGSNLAPVHIQSAAIDDFYIVELHEHADLHPHLSSLPAACSLLRHFTIGDWQGYAVHAPSEDALHALRSHSDIRSITQDAVVSIADLDDQSNAPWNLARISSRNPPSSTTYQYPDSAGANAFVYILDTGIHTQHSDFGGRASAGMNFVTSEPNTDLQMHGTHVAGIVGGTKYGVAKQANLVSVKVLDKNGQGSWSNILAGVSWVVSVHKADPKTIRICNLSLAGGFSIAINNAVLAATAAGVHMIIAAGNSAKDACDFSPSSAGGINGNTIITVGATQQGDGIASFSNYGECVDMFAPGARITSDLTNTVAGTVTMSGTSMAAPHVAGIAALVLSDINRNASPAALKTAIAMQITTKNKITGINMADSPNRLAFNQRIMGASIGQNEPLPTTPDEHIPLKSRKPHHGLFNFL